MDAFYASVEQRNNPRIEQAVGKLKRFKRIALRCEKTARNYGSFVAPWRTGSSASKRLVGSVQQLRPNDWPVLLQVVAKLIDRHLVDACATFVALHLPQCFLQIPLSAHILPP